ERVLLGARVRQHHDPDLVAQRLEPGALCGLVDLGEQRAQARVILREHVENRHTGPPAPCRASTRRTAASRVWGANGLPTTSASPGGAPRSGVWGAHGLPTPSAGRRSCATRSLAWRVTKITGMAWWRRIARTVAMPLSPSRSRTSASRSVGWVARARATASRW